MNYGQIQSTVLSRVTMDANDPVAAYVPGYINEGLHMVETFGGAAGWPWLRELVDFNTVANVSAYPFSTIDPTNTIIKILSLKVLRSNIYAPIELLSAWEADDIYVTNVALPPDAWYVDGPTVYIRPVPDGVYTVRCRAVRVEPDLVNMTDEPIMPPVFHSSIVAATLSLLYQSLQNPQGQTAAENQVNAWVQRMQRYGRESSPAPRVRVRDWLRSPGYQ